MKLTTMWGNLNMMIMFTILVMDVTHVMGKITKGRKDAEMITPRKDTIESIEIADRQGKVFKTK